MPGLALIGLGLYDEQDMSLRGIATARECEYVFAEFYTSIMPALNIERLEELIGRHVEILERRNLEEESHEIIKLASKAKVALLVPGDPLISTTHINLLLEAKKAGIPVKVVHNASIHSAAPGIAGLQNYKFGRSTSLPKPERGFVPSTPYYVIEENLRRGLHTLIFLDIGMNAREALELLLGLEAQEKRGVITGETLAVVISRAGAPEQKVTAGKIEQLLSMELGEPPQTIIIPGKLHFVEEEALGLLASLHRK